MQARHQVSAASVALAAALLAFVGIALSVLASANGRKVVLIAKSESTRWVGAASAESQGGDVLGYTLSATGWVPTIERVQQKAKGIQAATWYKEYMSRTAPSTSSMVWSPDNTMSKQASTNFNRLLSNVFPPGQATVEL